MHKSLSKEDRNMTTYGYARVSTDGQSLTSQDAELHAAGCAKVYAEKISGARSNRPELAKVKPAPRLAMTKNCRHNNSPEFSPNSTCPKSVSADDSTSQAASQNNNKTQLPSQHLHSASPKFSDTSTPPTIATQQTSLAPNPCRTLVGNCCNPLALLYLTMHRYRPGSGRRI